MIEIVFDLETNSKYIHEVNAVHSLVLYFRNTGKILSCADQFGFRGIEQGLYNLRKADRIIAHNGICYDLEVIKKLYGYDLNDKIYDTLNASRLIWPNLMDIDMKKSKVPGDCKGKHKLEAWGHRLGEHKGSFGKSTDWKDWSVEMQSYCVQDVVVTNKLYELILQKEADPRSTELEFEFQKYIRFQVESGAPFNTQAAKQLAEDLQIEKAQIKLDAQKVFPPKIIEMKTKTKRIPFNIGSRDQLTNYLISKKEWKPEVFSKTGKPTMSEEVLQSLPWEEAKLALKYFQVNNILSKLSEGKESWLNHVVDGKIHGGVITNGAITGRCTHSKPNLAQVTSPRKYKGAEARQLFEAPEGYSFVGADASGLELRMLGHYLFPYDEGDYVKAILDSDIHMKTVEAAGLPTRDHAKTFIYAHNYGAGDAKLGSIVEPLSSVERQRDIGKKLKKEFRLKIVGLGDLIKNVELVAKSRGFLRGLDGRNLPIREVYRALNTLLQGGGAIVMKQAGVRAHKKLTSLGYYKLGVRPALNVHDEMQFIVPDRLARMVGVILVESIIYAGEDFNLKCPLDGEFKVGKTWGQTH